MLGDPPTADTRSKCRISDGLLWGARSRGIGLLPLNKRALAVSGSNDFDGEKFLNLKDDGFFLT